MISHFSPKGFIRLAEGFNPALRGPYLGVPSFSASATAMELGGPDVGKSQASSR